MEPGTARPSDSLGSTAIDERVLVSAVNSVQRQFLPNGLPLMDASLMELPSTEKTGTGEESFGRLLG